MLRVIKALTGVFRGPVRWLLVVFLLVVGANWGAVHIAQVTGSNSWCLYREPPRGLGTLLDITSGARWDFPTSCWECDSLNLQEASHNDNYVAYLRPAYIGAREYGLLVKDRKADQVIFTLPNTARAPRDLGVPSYSVQWSPDDSWIAFQELVPVPSGYIKIFKPDGSQMQQINGVMSDYTWSADSQYLAVDEAQYDVPQRTQSFLHFWSPSERQQLVVPISGEYLLWLRWSPTAHVLAFLAASSPNASNAPFFWVIASPDNNRGVIDSVRFPPGLIAGLSSKDIQWSADGQYLLVQNRLFRFDGNHLTEIAHELCCDMRWSVEGHLLLYTRSRPDKLLDLMAFHVQTGSYEILLAGLVEQPQDIAGTPRILVRRRENGKFTVEIRDRDGANPLKLVEGADRITRVEMAPSNVVKAQHIWVEWVVEHSQEPTIWLTWALPNGSGLVTTKRSFAEASRFDWLNDRTMVFVEQQGHRLRAGLIDWHTGNVNTLVTAADTGDIFYWLVSPNQIMFRWWERNKLILLAGYDLQGKQLYRWQVEGGTYPSPDGLHLLIENYGASPANRFTILSFQTGEQKELPVPAGQVQFASGPIWSPDGEFFALTAETQSQDASLHIFNKEGQHIQQFALFALPKYTNELRWVRCNTSDELAGMTD